MSNPGRLAASVLIAGLVALAGCTGNGTTARKESVQHKGPQWQAAEVTRDVGEVDLAKTGEYVFTVSNKGDEPLKLKVARKSCTCGEVLLPGDIAPGEEGKITIRWTPTPGKVGPYTLSTDLETNDPRPKKQVLHLEVKGHINPLIRVSPDDISVNFDRIDQGQHGLREIKVYSTKLDAFELNAQASEPGLLKVTTTPLVPGTMVDDLRATSGYSIVLETTDKLPAGYFLLSLILNLKPPQEPARKLVLDVSGEVANSLIRVTPREVEFKQPKVTDADHKKVRVQFFVPKDTDKLEITKLEPSFLKFDSPHRIGNQWEFELRIPPKNQEAARFQADGGFEGRVVLKATANGKSVEVPVRVFWARPETDKKE